MAVIERHPLVRDYIVEISLSDIVARRGVADLFEDGRLILLKDFRLDFDFEALSGLCKSLDAVDDQATRRELKKMTVPMFFAGPPPKRRWGRLCFADPVRQSIYDVLCRGDRRVFNRVSRALEGAHRQLLELFSICFPDYDAFRFVPSARLTTTLFENLHWDNHGIDEDFHQARIFANIDKSQRIWSVSHRLADWMRTFYIEYDLGRFADKDPNVMINFITGEVFGGTANTWMENEPRHRIAFAPGEVWLAESRQISHQIYYGENALVYMWFVRTTSMADAGKRFNKLVEDVHREMACTAQSHLKPSS